MIIYDRNGQPLVDVDEAVKSFDELNLPDADFTGLQLEGAGFDACNLVREDFSNADLYWARFDEVNCAGACFKGASLRGASVWNSHFAHADLTEIDLEMERDARGVRLLTEVTDEIRK